MTFDSTPATDPAQEIRQLHQEIAAITRDTLDRAIRIGALLIERKSAIGHGMWLPWIKSNLPFSQQTASNYIRVCENRKTIERKLPTLGNLSDAYRLLSEPKAAKITSSKFPKSDPKPIDAEIVDAPASPTPPTPEPPSTDRVPASLNRFADKFAEGIKTADEEMACKSSAPAAGKFHPSHGLRYASMAIAQLESINKDDTQRIEAFRKVREWLDEQEVAQ